jgi:CheY-like chemotaxis protein
MTRILVIEPELRARHALRNMLEGAGYEVEMAADGSDGAARHRHQPADLIIADIDDVADSGKAFDGIKFIAVPGNGRSGCGMTREAARRLGAQELLPKPFRRDALLAAVRSTIG